MRTRERTLITGIAMAFFACFGYGLLLQFQNESAELKEELKMAREEIIELRAERHNLLAEKIALTTPDHVRAFHLIKSWKEVCTRIPAERRMGHIGCKTVLQEGLQNDELPRELQLHVLATPTQAIQAMSDIIVDGCELIDMNHPPICQILAEGLSN